LDEFFFDSDRNLLDSETRSMVLIIQSSKVNAQLTHRLISSPSISHLVFGSKASRGSKIYVLIKALIKTITSISLDRNFLNTAGILHDIFEVNLLREGNFHERINFVFVTNSSFYNFPSIFYLERKTRHFQTEMLHYSENSLPLTDLEFQEKGLPAWIFNSRVDIHKVWTTEYAKFLTSANPSLLVEAVGSLIFRPREPRNVLNKRKSNKYQILLLDVNPSIFESKNGPYTEFAGKSFLDCINDVHPFLMSGYEPRPIFKIKSKRRRIPGHSIRYLEQKDRLIEQGVIEEVSWHTNLYTLIADSDVVLCSIGTSPGLIARELGIPVAMFYGGENKLMDPLVDYGIPLLQNPAAVYSFISNNLGKK
jgi:polysaccharide biosynthesis PFTS motif protein